MLQSFIGVAIGAFIGWIAGAFVANMGDQRVLVDFHLLVMSGLGSGAIVGSIIGSTTAIIHAIKQDRSLS